MSIITFFLCFCIFCAWLFYEQQKSKKIQEKQTAEFWEREARANATRNKDTSDIPMIEVTESMLPVVSCNDESVNYYLELLKDNIRQPMADLSSYSNTDLKLAYGVGNFKTLSEYDENYTIFLQNITNLARSCGRCDAWEDAAAVYRFALSCGSMKSIDYSGLADCYKHLGTPEKIRDLIHELEEKDHPHSASIIQELSSMPTEQNN